MLSASKGNQDKVGKGFSIFFALYFAFFVTLPLVFSEKIIDPVLLPRQIFLTVFIFLVLGIFAIQIANEKKQMDFGFLKKPIPIILTLSLVVSAISMSSAIVVSESIYVLSKEAIVLVFCLLTVSLLIQKQISTKQLSICVFGFMTVTISIGFYQLWSSDGDFSLLKSTMANKNLLSSVLFLCIPFLFKTYYVSNKWKAFTIVLSFALVGVFWITQSKAVIMAVIMAVIIFMLLSSVKPLVIFFKTKTGSLIATSLAVIIGGLVLITFQNKDLFPHLFNSNTVIIRINLWQNSLEMIRENPFFGVGVGNWNIHFSKYGFGDFNHSVQNGFTIYQRAHNHFVQVFCEKGIFGVVLFISLFVMIIRAGLKIIKRTTDQKEAAFLRALTCIAVGFLFICAVDYPLERIEHLLLFSISIAIILSNQELQLKNKVKKNKGQLLLVFSVALAVFSMVISYNRYRAESYFSKIHIAHKKAQWGKLLKIAKKVDSKYYEIDPTSIPKQWYTGVAKFSKGDIKGAKTEFELAFQLNPYNIHVLNNLASCYEKEGNHPEAEKLYKNILAISPNFQESILNLSAVYFNGHEYEKAFQTINKCPTSSTDEKYKTFLPAILRAKLRLILAEEINPIMTEKYRSLIDSTVILNTIYMQSKTKSITFEKNLKQSI